MPKTITAKDLKQKIDSGDKFYLIDVLSAESFGAKHLPTAVNIPNGPELVKQVEALGAGKDDYIIVYCASATCPDSPAAAAALEKAGFTNVADFDDGLAGWQEAGYEFES